MDSSRSRQKIQLGWGLPPLQGEVPWSWQALAAGVLILVSAWVLNESRATRWAFAKEVDLALVDLNFSTESELDSLPGIGPSLARAIMLGRPYSCPEHLVRVKGISTRMMGPLRPLIKVTQGRRIADRSQRELERR